MIPNHFVEIVISNTSLPPILWRSEVEDSKSLFRRCSITIDIQGEITIQIQKHYYNIHFCGIHYQRIWNSLLATFEITIDFLLCGIHSSGFWNHY